MDYLVYTDGSCSAKDRAGGYAYKIVDEAGNEHMGGGYENDTTISRMELMAAIGALRQIDAWDDGHVVLLFSDSEYVVKGFMNPGRARNKNVDLWLWLDDESRKFNLVHMTHVKGHNGHTDNEDCDKLAGEFRQAALRDLTGNTFT